MLRYINSNILLFITVFDFVKNFYSSQVIYLKCINLEDSKIVLQYTTLYFSTFFIRNVKLVVGTYHYGPDRLESIIFKIIDKKSIICLVIYNLLFQKIIDFLPIIQGNNTPNNDYLEQKPCRCR